MPSDILSCETTVGRNRREEFNSLSPDGAPFLIFRLPFPAFMPSKRFVE
jgi:hypothetical protein